MIIRISLSQLWLFVAVMFGNHLIAVSNANLLLRPFVRRHSPPSPPSPVDKKEKSSTKSAPPPNPNPNPRKEDKLRGKKSQQQQDAKGKADRIQPSLNQRLVQIRKSVSQSQQTIEAAIHQFELEHCPPPLGARRRSRRNNKRRNNTNHPVTLVDLYSNNLHFSWILAQLSGWDMCAVVSAVITLISIYFYDHRISSSDGSRRQNNIINNNEKNNWINIDLWDMHLNLAMNLIGEGLNYAAIASGLFGTIVFSLLSIHGRKNIRMFEQFYRNTIQYQKQGSTSFRTSIDLLGVQTLLFLQSQMESHSLQWAGVAIIGFGFWKRLREVQSNLNNATHS